VFGDSVSAVLEPQSTPGAGSKARNFGDRLFNLETPGFEVERPVIKTVGWDS
jgi:hypothetical protein